MISENVLKEIFESKYGTNQFDEDNYIRNILVHFLYLTALNGGEKNRLEYDCDAFYYKKHRGLTNKEALYADTISSFWTPYSLAIYIVTGVKYRKTKESIKKIIELIDNKDSKILSVNKIFEPFARIYYTKGNFMLLPHRMMNNSRYKICQDRIDETVYECFDDGKLSCYFKDNNELIKWINEQNLISIFRNRNIDKEYVIKFNKQSKFNYSTSLDEIQKYIDRSVELILERNR